MNEFEVARPGGRCHVSGRQLEPGEDFYTVLIETPQGFERRDYSMENWQGPPGGAFCHFKTRLPSREGPKRTFVDDDVLINFFLRLAGSEEAMKLRFRFVLSLILLRKRLLKYERTIREDEKEFWEMRLMRDKTAHRVFNPALNDTEIGELTTELGSILAGHVPDELESETADAEATPPEPQAETAG